MSTRPATAPEQKPSTLGLPLMIQSHIGQTNEPTAVAMVVVVNALAEIMSPRRAAGVESVPADPEHGGSDIGQHDAVRGQVPLRNPSVCRR